MLDGIFEQI